MLETHLLNLFLAALVGGAIGLEREYRDKSAGFRTMILIAVGSCLFTIISTEMPTSHSDNTRIAAAVVSGIGFLGAGVILKDGVSIHGMTTAASIWLVAALGMSMGYGMYEIASIVTIAILSVLWFFPYLEQYVRNLHEFVTYSITIKNSDELEAELLDLIRHENVNVVHIGRSQDAHTERTLHVKLISNSAHLEKLSHLLANDKGVLRFDSRSPR